MFRLAAKTMCLSFIAFAAVALACGVDPLDGSIRAGEAAAGMGIAVMLGGKFVLRLAASAYVNGMRPTEEQRGTNRSK